jgi:ribose/xylose/arabinose/galactoside ABC-type transport system permease subunit
MKRDVSLLSPAVLRLAAIAALLGAIVATFSLLEPRYASYSNFAAITRHMAANGLAALGLTFVVVVRRFDLSFPGIATFAAVTIGFMIASGHSLLFSIGVGLLAGVPIGLLNGWAVGFLGLPDIVVTIGSGSIAAGMAFFYTGGQTIFENFMQSGIIDLNDMKFLKLNVLVYMMLVAYLVAGIVLHRTRAGIGFYATGDNPVSAFFSGIRTKAYVMAAFGICALTSVLAVVLLIASSGNASTNHGATLLMPAYAGVFLGAALLGGASIPATFVGTVVITVLLDGFSLLGVPYYYSDGMVSAILLAGVIAFDERIRTRLASAARPLGLRRNEVSA